MVIKHLNTKHAVVLLFLSILNFRTSSALKTYQCVDRAPSPLWSCEVSGIAVSFEEPHLNLNSAVDISKVSYTILSSSTIPVLTSDICNSLPYLNRIDVHKNAIEIVDEDAFVNCSSLTKVELYENKIKQINPNTFNQNLRLQYIYLQKNLITEIPKNLFQNLTNLKELFLTENKIVEFPAEAMQNLTSLTNFGLQSNKMFDFDVEKCVEYIPNLQVIYLRDNNIECSRWTQIKENLLGSRISISNYIYSTRKRSYKISKVDGFECLTKEQKEIEKEEIQIEQFLDPTNLKFNSLYRSIQDLNKNVSNNMENITVCLSELELKLKRTNKTWLQEMSEVKNFVIYNSTTIRNESTNKINEIYKNVSKLLDTQAFQVSNLEERLTSFVQSITTELAHIKDSVKDHSEKASLSKKINNISLGISVPALLIAILLIGLFAVNHYIKQKQGLNQSKERHEMNSITE